MRFADLVFLTVDDIDAMHDGAIVAFGGTPGVRDRGLIESAVMGPQIGYYGSCSEIAAAYVYGLAKNHGYVDGNKRTAALALRIFLSVNGLPCQLGPEWALHIEAVANGTMAREDLVTKIGALIGGDVPIELP